MASHKAASGTPLTLALGERLRGVRQIRGLSQRQVAEQGLVSLVERGWGGLKVTQLVELCDALQIPPSLALLDLTAEEIVALADEEPE